MRELYLAYGSNLHPERLCRRTPSASVVAVVSLPGWRIAFHKRGFDGSGKCNLLWTDDPRETAYGVLYTLRAVERPALDEAERGYRIAHLTLEGGVTAFTYLAESERIDHQARPYPWYRSLVVAGARYHGFPDEYVARLEAVDTVDDPDPVRVAQHDALLQVLMAPATLQP